MARARGSQPTDAGRGIRLIALGVVAGVIAALGVALPASAAQLVEPPTRLYLMPDGESPFPPPIPFPVVPEGELLFDDGDDLISGDTRNIEIESTVPEGADPEDADCDPGPTWDVTGCVAVQLDVGHGLLDFTAAPSEITFDPTPDDGTADEDVVYQLPGGALVRDMDSADDLPALATAVIGTIAQVNDALDLLRYTPDDDYHYTGSNPETLSVDVVTTDHGSQTHDIEIRVLGFNDFPELTVPSTLYTVDPGQTVAVNDAADAWNVVDEDNDETTDSEDPPGSGNDPDDGAGDKWLTVIWTSCGQIELFTDGMTLYDNYDAAIDFALNIDPSLDPAILTAITEALFEVLPDEVASLPLTTTQPGTAFLGVVDDIDSLIYDLNNIEFDAVVPGTSTPLPAGVCDIRTFITDLGNNGLPLQYLGDPPTGAEVPLFGFDVDTNDAPGVEKVQVQVGEAQEIDVTLADATVAEGASGVVTATISPATHPAFELTASTADASATAGADYSAFTGLTVTVPADAGTVDIPVASLGDLEFESPDETFSVTAIGPAVAPVGYEVTVSDGTAVVTITDDDPEPEPEPISVSVPDLTILESDPDGEYVVLAISPANHPPFTLSVASADGTATAGADYTAIPAYTVAIGADATTFQVPVDALQDALYESPDETYTLTAGKSGPDPEGWEVVLADAQGVITIDDDDPEPDPDPDPETISVSVGDVTVAEGDSDEVEITVSPATHPPFTLSVVSADATATAGADYTALPSQNLAIGANETSFVVPVDALQDLLVEVPDETYTVTAFLSGLDPEGYEVVLADAQGTVTIDDDDSPPDDTAPTVTINQGAGQADPTGTSPIVFDVVFSEPVTGLTPADIVLSGDANPTTAVISGSGSAYTVQVSGMSVNGDVVADVAAGAAEDAAGNPSAASASTDNTVAYNGLDDTGPTVTINQGAGQADPTGTSPIVFDVVFSEPVTGLTPADIVLSGDANPTTAVISGSGSAYTVQVSGMSANGDVVADVAPGAAEDAAGNPSAASTSTDNTVTYNENAPEPDPLEIQVPDDIVVDAPPGEPGVAVTFPEPTTTGGVEPVDVACDHVSGDVFPIGVTTVTCTATDSAPPEEIVLFAVVSDSFTITVNETDEPAGPGGPTTPGTPDTPGTPGRALPPTGSDPLPVLGLAILLLAAGAVAIRVAQRVRRTPQS